jgi:hypothetical protein
MVSVRALRLIWTVIRLPIVAVLVLCAPLVRFVLGSLTLLMVIAAAVWALEKPLGSAPVVSLLAGAFALASLQLVYRLLLRVLSG